MIAPTNVSKVLERAASVGAYPDHIDINEHDMFHIQRPANQHDADESHR